MKCYVIYLDVLSTVLFGCALFSLLSGEYERCQCGLLMSLICFIAAWRFETERSE